MSIFTILFELLTNIPAIISIVKSIIELISALGSGPAKAKAYADLSAAYQDFKATGSTAKLNALHDSLSTTGNAPDTVGNT